jgi:hypothetical protein
MENSVIALETRGPTELLAAHHFAWTSIILTYGAQRVVELWLHHLKKEFAKSGLEGLLQLRCIAIVVRTRRIVAIRCVNRRRVAHVSTPELIA